MDTITVSFEFFPPKTEVLAQTFWDTITYLNDFAPEFVSVTQRVNTENSSISIDTTYTLVNEISRRIQINAVPHLTGVGSTKTQLTIAAKRYWDAGIRRIVALRGDYPSSYSEIYPKFYAFDLVNILKEVADFNIAVAAYPEVHPQATSAETDLQYLKAKIAAGADLALTQAFFNVENYLRFRDRCSQAGILVDIVPGILPITSYAGLLKLAQTASIEIPNWIHEIYTKINPKLNINNLIGLNIAIDMVNKLVAEGVRRFHFYTLNHYELTYTICHLLQHQYKLNINQNTCN